MALENINIEGTGTSTLPNYSELCKVQSIQSGKIKILNDTVSITIENGHKIGPGEYCDQVINFSKREIKELIQSLY